MAAPYSPDLRTRVVAAAAGGQTCRQIAKVFSMAPSTVSNWTRRLRETGSPAALPMGGKRPFALAQHRDWVLARVAERPDLTLLELKAELAGRGVLVSVFAIWHFLKRQGISFNVWPAPFAKQLLRSDHTSVCVNVCGPSGIAVAKMEIRAFRSLIKTSA
jgi:transposase